MRLHYHTTEAKKLWNISMLQCSCTRQEKNRRKFTEQSVRSYWPSPDVARIKAVVSALEGVDIEQAIKEAAVTPAAPAAATEAAPQQGEKKVDNKPSEEEQKQNEEQAAEGLGALFG